MDDPVESIQELEENLTDIERANALLGGVAPVLREIRRLRPRSLLDVGCGSADIPLAVVRDASRRGVQLDVTALDRSEQMVSIAKRRTGNDGRLRFVIAEGERLPFEDAAFDVVTCNLALHHFEPPGALKLLRELRRVARLAPLVCDLRRSRAAYGAALAWSQLFSRNRLTRHDAPLSVRRAYTPAEALQLARLAGWRRPAVQTEAFFRMMLSDSAASTGRIFP